MVELSRTIPQGSHSARLVVIVLIGAVVLLLVLLTWFGTSAAPIHQEQFAQLLDAELLSSISIGTDGLEVRLTTPVRVASQGTRTVTDHVHVSLPSRPSESEIQDWQMRGVHVGFRDATEQRRRNAGGLAIVGVLLSLGIWHLVMEIREDRHGLGSPRRRLRALDEALAEGSISKEEHRNRAQEIWAEM